MKKLLIFFLLLSNVCIGQTTLTNNNHVTVINKTMDYNSNTFLNFPTPTFQNLTIFAPLTGGTYNGSAPISIGITMADATHNGYLTSTDWNTFNGKQSALTIGNLTDAGTDGIVVTGGLGSVIGSGTSLAQHVADISHNGYLSSTDWSTFNNKQNSLKFGADFTTNGDSLFIKGDWVNVVDFGAVGDGTTNNTAAFQAAVATGKNVFVPDGTFILSTQVSLQPRQRIFGNGWNTIVKITANVRGIVPDSFCVIEGLHFIGNGKAGTGAFNTGVFCFQKIGWSIQNCFFESFAGDPQQNGGGAIYVTSLNSANSDGGRISNNYFLNNDGALVFASRGEYVTADHNTFGGNTVAVLMGAGNLTVNDNIIQNNTTGIKVIDGTNTAHSTVTNNLINHNTYPLDIQDVPYSLGMVFADNMIYRGAPKFTRAYNIKFTGGQWDQLDSIRIDSSRFLQRIGVMYGAKNGGGVIPVTIVNHSQDFTTIGEFRSDTSTLNWWIRQRNIDSIGFIGPLYYTGTPSASASSSDSVWVKDSNGQLHFRAQSSIGATAFSGLTDVNVSSPSNNQFAQYQTSDSKWHNHTLVAGDIPDLSATYQPLDADLTTISGLTATTNNFLVSVSSAWASRTPAQVKTTLSLDNVDNTSDATKNSATATLTNKRITARYGSTTSSGTPTINTDNVDVYELTAQAVNITSFTTNLSGSPTTDQVLHIAITTTGTITIAMGASFEASSIALPTGITGATRVDYWFMYTAAGKWRIIGSL